MSTVEEIRRADAQVVRELEDRRFEVGVELAHLISEHHRIARQHEAMALYLATEPLRRESIARAEERRKAT